MKLLNKDKSKKTTKKTKKPKTIKPPQPSAFNKISAAYKSLCYKTIGKYIPYKENKEELNIKLKKARMNFIAEVFLSVIIITSIIVAIASLIGYYVLFKIIIQSQSWMLYMLGLTGLTTFVTAVYLPGVMKSRISNRGQQINQSIPFSLSQLSILASTGLSPIKIFRHMAQGDSNVTINQEFRKLIYKTDIEGKDIITALGETAKESPSDKFRETLWDLANMIHQGGDLDIYLRGKADESMQLKRDIQKEFIEKLAGLSEMYVSLVLVGTLFLGIAAFLMDAMATTMGGINSETLILALTFIIIPVAVFVINTLVSMAYSKSG